jgi:hypothetical protein
LSHLGFVYSIVRYGYEMYKFRQKVGLVSFYKTKKCELYFGNGVLHLSILWSWLDYPFLGMEECMIVVSSEFFFNLHIS